MSEKEYKEKTENMFARNTVLINENEQLKARIEILEAENILLRNCLNCKKGIPQKETFFNCTLNTPYQIGDKIVTPCMNHSKWESKN